MHPIRENMFLYALDQSLIDILGDTWFDSALEEEIYISGNIQFIERYLSEKISRESIPGVSRQAGRASLKYHLDQIEICHTMGLIENKLLPFPEKILKAFSGLSEDLNKIGIAQFQIKQTSKMEWNIKGNLIYPEGSILLLGQGQFFLGYLEQFLEWVDSRYSYLVSLQGKKLTNEKRFDILISCSLSE